MIDRHRAEVRRRMVEGRAYAVIACLAARELPTFQDLAYELNGVSSAELTEALESLAGKGRVVVEKSPSPINPLFDPPVVRYRPVGLQGGASLTSKAGD